MRHEDVDFLLLFLYVASLITTVTGFLGAPLGRVAPPFLAGGLALSLAIWCFYGSIGAKLFGGTLFIIGCMCPLAMLPLST